MVGLPGAVVIDGLVVDDSSGRSIMLRGYDHPTEPAGGLIDRHSLQYAEPDVPVQPGLHLVGPVYGDGGRGVHSHWLGRLVHEQPHGWAVLHEGERLPLAYIEGTGCIPGEDVVSEDGQVSWGGVTGESWWCCGW